MIKLQLTYKLMHIHTLYINKIKEIMKLAVVPISVMNKNSWDMVRRVGTQS